MIWIDLKSNAIHMFRVLSVCQTGSVLRRETGKHIYGKHAYLLDDVLE